MKWYMRVRVECVGAILGAIIIYECVGAILRCSLWPSFFFFFSNGDLVAILQRSGWFCDGYTCAHSKIIKNIIFIVHQGSSLRSGLALCCDAILLMLELESGFFLMVEEVLCVNEMSKLFLGPIRWLSLRTVSGSVVSRTGR